MASPTIDDTQGYTASITRDFDMAEHLAENGALTIVTATVTCTNPAAEITDESNTATSVAFTLATTGITTPTVLPIVITPTYDNGNVDPRTIHIQITNT